MDIVSIIIPCFNDGRYLREAVASAHAQTYPDIEIIVVDDHSTDPVTRARLQDLTRQGICVLSTPEGVRGPSAARNMGIRAAKGEFILPLDADDRIDPTYVEKAATRMKANPNIGICYCKARFFGLKRGPWRLPPYSWEELLCGNMIFATALFRKKDWKAVAGYDESLVSGLEDYALWLRIIDLGRDVEQLDEELFYYRIKQHSRTATIASSRKEMQVVMDVCRSCESVFMKNTPVLLQSIHRMKQREASYTCLIGWKLLQPVFTLEQATRKCVKKALGRI